MDRTDFKYKGKVDRYHANNTKSMMDNICDTLISLNLDKENIQKLMTDIEKFGIASYNNGRSYQNAHLLYRDR